MDSPTYSVLSQDDAELELARLATAGYSRRDAARKLRRRGLLLPVAGGSPEGDDGGSGDGAGSGAGSGSGDGANGGQGAANGAGSGDGAGEWTPPSREEYEAMQRERDEARNAAAKADRARRERERKAAEEAGNYEELHKQSSAELERVKNLVVSGAKRDAVSEVAARLRFRNPSLAHKLISLDGINAELDLDGDEPTAAVDQGGKGLIESRLKAVLEAEPYLAGEGQQRQLPGAGQGNGQTGAGHSDMNQAIRRAAGRA